MFVSQGQRSISPQFGDIARQVVNVLCAIGQVAATALTAINGTSGNFSDNTNAATTPIVPAGYVFAVWGLIYAGGLVYAVYQALPAQRSDPLLRQIGWYTALGYLGTSLWLLCAAKEWYWVTVGCFVLILIGMLGAFVRLLGYRGTLSRAAQIAVVLPISVYTGWTSIALVANVSTALQNSGVTHPFLPDAAWAVLMLLVAGGIASFVTIVSRGNLSYALTVIWALIGVVVANLTRDHLPAVAFTAGLLALVLGGIVVWARQRAPRLN
jgi:hypothetical protein